MFRGYARGKEGRDRNSDITKEYLEQTDRRQVYIVIVIGDVYKNLQ